MGTGDKIGLLDNWDIYWLGDEATSVLPLGGHTNRYCRRGPPHKIPAFNTCVVGQFSWLGVLLLCWGTSVTI